MKEERHSRLDEFVRRPRRAMWIMAAPMMIGFMAHALFVIIDTVFIGRLGRSALAAVTYISVLFFALVALNNGLATGITAQIARAVGQRDSDEADRIASGALGFAVLLGVVIAAAGLLFGPRFIPLLGASGDSAALAWDFFQLICAGVPLMLAGTVIRAVMSGEGDARTPMYVLGGATVLNLALDPLFIFTLHMGIRGASLATLIAQAAVMVAFGLVVLLRRRAFSRLRLSMIMPRWRELQPILAIGVPTALGQWVMSFGMGLVNRLLATYGQATVAGFGAGSKVDMLIALPVLGLAGAAVSIVGMFSGAKRADLVRSSVLYAYRWVLLLSVGLGSLAYLGAGTIIGAFSKDPHVVSVGTQYLGYMVFAYPFMSLGIISGRILQGLGHGLPSLMITAIRVLLVAVPGAYIAVHLFGAPVTSVWIMAIVGGVVSNVVGLLWVRSLVWHKLV